MFVTEGISEDQEAEFIGLSVKNKERAEKQAKSLFETVEGNIMAKYNITRKMMHKQLRFKGSIVRKVMPYYKPSTFSMFNKFFRLFVLKKEKNTCGINIRNIYMDRNTGTENRLILPLAF